LVEADSEAGKVHDNATLVADDLALARGRGLQEVLMELNRKNARAERGFHQDGGGVFDVDVEVAPMAAESVDAARQAEEGIEVVELVNLGEDDAAAEVGASGVHNAVVLVWVPVREVFADSCTDAEQVAKHAGADNFGEPYDARVKAQLVADHGDALMLAGQIDEFRCSLERVGKRFFEEDVAAGDKAG